MVTVYGKNSINSVTIEKRTEEINAECLYMLTCWFLHRIFLRFQLSVLHNIDRKNSLKKIHSISTECSWEVSVGLDLVLQLKFAELPT